MRCCFFLTEYEVSSERCNFLNYVLYSGVFNNLPQCQVTNHSDIKRIMAQKGLLLFLLVYTANIAILPYAPQSMKTLGGLCACLGS